MATTTVLESAAASAVGTDLMDGNKLSTSSLPRRVTHIGVVGSTNPSDAAVDLFYGSTFMGKFFNTTGGATVIPKADADLIPVGGPLVCAPNEPIHVFISDASLANVLAVTLVIQEIIPQRTTYPRRRY